MDEGTLEELALRVEMTPRHLRRLFQKHLGTTPSQLALTQRLETARRLLNETDLNMTDLGFAAGFSSLRSFNDAFQRVYRLTPSKLRRKKVSGKEIRLRLAFRPPYDWTWMASYLKARALPGIEAVDCSSYRRIHRIEEQTFRLALEWTENFVEVVLEQGPSARRLALAIRDVSRRANRLLDLHLNPSAMQEHLGNDPLLAPHLQGVRLPQSWDRFETGVRTILGQQVSVQAATTLAGRLAERFSEGGGFPSPETLQSAPLEEIGLPSSRAATIRHFSRRVVDQPGCLSEANSVQALSEIKGIGPWTVGYFGMRGLGYPDAFCEGDLVLRKMCGGLTNSELKQRAEVWRPWRAYAAMALWKGASLCATQ